MIRKIKKGFTLVELVVVIAVVAILAAVSVVSYLGITKKAKESHDQQIVDQINLSLKAEVEAGRKPETMHKALEIIKEDGFLPEKFGDLHGTAKDSEFAFILNESKFVILNKSSQEVVYPTNVNTPAKYDIWKFADSISEVSGDYSYYLSGSELSGDITIVAGLDVGYNSGIKTIKYDTHDKPGSRSVVIRTDGGFLTINAPEDNVKHFGEADNVNVIAVKSSSYHEYGTVAIIQVASGRIELEASSDVDGIHINAKVTNVAPDGTVTYSTTEFADDITLTVGGKDVTLTRDSVGDANIGGDSKLLVCKVETETKSEYIWLDGDGTIENSNVYVSSKADGSDASSVTASNASEAAKAIANNAINTGTEENPVYTPIDTGISINTDVDKEVWATYDSQAKLEYLINSTSFTNLKQTASILDMTNVDIPSGRSVNIDLNGYTIDAALQSSGRHYYAFYNYGELTLEDSSANKTSYVKARGIQNSGGKMTINSGKFYSIDTNGGAAVWNENYMVQIDGKYIKSSDLQRLIGAYGEQARSYFESTYIIEDFSSDYNYVSTGSGFNLNSYDGKGFALIYNKYEKEVNQADLTINGGEFIVEHVGSSSDSGGPGCLNSQPGSKLTINGGTFTSANMRVYTIIADGETVINDCTVVGAHGALAIDAGSATINGGSFTCSEYYGCWITNDGTDTKVTINGGTFSGKYGLYSSVDDGGQDESNVAITINGGSFEGTSGSAIINAKQSTNQFALMIYGGRFSSDPSTYVSSSYTITESDGWFIVTQ